MSTGSAIIDAHHHVWSLADRPQPWLDPEPMARIRRDFELADLAPEARAAGVTHTILVQTVDEPAETPELLARAAADPLVAGVVGWVDLTAPAVGEALAALRAGPGGDRLVGIRHLVQQEADPRWLCRADVRRGLRAVAEAGLVFDLLVLPHQLPAARETVAELPELTFVLDHLAKPPIAAGELEPWASRLHDLAAAGRVAAKLSGLVTEAGLTSPMTLAGRAETQERLRPYADVALEAFGPDRLMFGSDWPVCLLAADSYDVVVRTARALVAQLPPGQQDAIFAGTARRWYGLSL